VIRNLARSAGFARIPPIVSNRAELRNEIDNGKRRSHASTLPAVRRFAPATRARCFIHQI
jgi:hypothetical protein